MNLTVPRIPLSSTSHFGQLINSKYGKKKKIEKKKHGSMYRTYGTRVIPVRNNNLAMIGIKGLDDVVVVETTRKLSSTKKWKKVWKVMHNAVLIFVLTLLVMLATMSAPPAATAAATAGSIAIKTAEQWINSFWADRLDALKNEKDVILMMKGNNLFGVHELESIRAMLERLEIRIESVSDYAELALANQEEEIVLKMAMNDIEPRVGEIGKWVDEVEMKVNAYDGEIGKAVVEFLNVIISDL